MTVLSNARLVLDDEVVAGHLAFEDGTIVAVAEGNARGEDCAGEYLIPGLVELHTDHLESHVVPRPMVRWDMTAAVQAHDAQMAVSGITTVFDTLRVGIDDGVNLTTADFRTLADAVARAQEEGRLRAEHRFHLRCEVSEEGVVPGFHLFDDLAGVALVSLMDHTPGQRQFVSPAAYKAYFQRKSGLDDARFDAWQDELRRRAAIWSDRNRQEIAALALARSAVVASHDDATLEHVAEAVRDGVSLAEFPTTLEAAKASRVQRIMVMMGGPNLVRGGSHSGNVSAGELADAGALDILSSDYVPFSMLQAAFALGERPGWSLPRAVKTVAAAPAAVVGLADRGRLGAGLRADVVRVRQLGAGDIPVVTGVWRAGIRVA